MADKKSESVSTLRLTRTFEATREKVFHAWTDAEKLKRWFGPVGYAAPIAEVNLRVGGKYRLGMRKLPNGDIFYLSGTYREVRPPEKLVYTWFWENEPELGETLVTVEFRARKTSTEVVVTHELFPNQNIREDHDKGWNSCLDRLALAH